MGFAEDVVDGPQRLGPVSSPFLPPNVPRGKRGETTNNLPSRSARLQAPSW